MAEGLIWAGIGAFFGGCARAWLSDRGNGKSTHWQWGTILANCIGCFFIGLWLGLVAVGKAPINRSTLVATGFCGGLTTFSTFSLEVHHLFVKHKRKDIACIYWIGSVIGCILCVFIGVAVGQL